MAWRISSSGIPRREKDGPLATDATGRNDATIVKQ